MENSQESTQMSNEFLMELLAMSPEELKEFSEECKEVSKFNHNEWMTRWSSFEDKLGSIKRTLIDSGIEIYRDKGCTSYLAWFNNNVVEPLKESEGLFEAVPESFMIALDRFLKKNWLKVYEYGVKELNMIVTLSVEDYVLKLREAFKAVAKEG